MASAHVFSFYPRTSRLSLIPFTIIVLSVNQYLPLLFIPLLLCFQLPPDVHNICFTRFQKFSKSFTLLLFIYAHRFIDYYIANIKIYRFHVFSTFLSLFFPCFSASSQIYAFACYCKLFFNSGPIQSTLLYFTPLIQKSSTFLRQSFILHLFTLP